MADTKVIQPVKKEKKKDKTKKKDGENTEKFKPVVNPDFNPIQIMPFSVNKQEQWTISFAKTNSTVTTQKTQQTMTPTERQGHTAETYFPANNYTHLDPSKSNNIYSAFNQLQQKFSPPMQIDHHQQPQHYKQVNYRPASQQITQQPQTQPPPPPQQSQQQQPQQQQQQQPQQQQPQQQQPQPQKQPQPQQVQQSRRPTHLQDGAKIVSYVRASWPYTAEIPSELSFNANDTFAVIKKQPDGWWYAELLDPNRRTRGLVPGNYMIPY